jgi:acyl-CoA synthetase (AMP-forming)/AMP-acid ligase II
MCDIGLGDDLKAIEVRGRGIIDAYYKPWRTREEILTDGWFATGDLGKLDEEGYLFILGRSKEVISVGGMKFFPQEVEAVLETYPGVKSACVFGHEHKRLGEVSHAQVVLQGGAGHSVTEAQLREHCLKHLTAFKVPEKIEFVDKLALTASGKLIRTQIKIHQ